MITLAQLTELIGWASVLNIGILVLATTMLAFMRAFVVSLHRRFFDIPADDLAVIYFKYLANYKSLVLVFFVTPYLALKIMGH